MTLDKNQVCERLCRIESLRVLLDQEVRDLRAYLEVGDSITTPAGKVHLVGVNRTSYDEAQFLKDLLEKGIDPTLIGGVVVSINRKMLAEAIQQGVIPTDIVEKNSSNSVVPTLRIMPNN